MTRGKVYIIGAGPGSYKLLTLRAVECIGKSDMIVYDRLIDNKVLDFASDKAGFVYVGKQAELHQVPQTEINNILLQLAMEGKTVARVKGGDPFLFGRGGEECEFLQEHGIEFEVVPGITSAIAVPAYAGIPVTHRDYASSLHIITGHKGADNEDEELDFEILARLEGTLVFLMGVKNLGKICTSLLENGKSADTPAAIIENGAGLEQRVLTGRLDDIAEKSAEAGIKSPAVIVIGSVAKLAEKLAWYGKGPLFGKRVVVTRPAGRADKLVQGLEENGAQVIEFPVIKISEVEDDKPLRIALESIRDYQWLVFTSANGVDIFFRQLNRFKKDIRLLSGLKLAAVGPATAESLREKGLYADFVPEKYTTRDLLEGLLKLVNHKDKVLLLRSEIAGTELSDGLRENGISFDDVAVYKTEENTVEKSELINLINGNKIDYVTFTSPSTVKAFVSIIGSKDVKNPAVKFVCIGPVTAAAANELGLEVSGFAEEYTEDGIINKLIELSEV